MKPKRAEKRNRGSVLVLMQAIKTLQRPVDSAVLEQLQAALYRSGDPPSAEQKAAAITEAAAIIVSHTPPAIELIMQVNDYDMAVREPLLKRWKEVPFESRMTFRELFLSVVRFETLFRALAEVDGDALLDAMSPGDRARFMFSRNQNLRMVHDLRPLLEGDEEIAKYPTVDRLWNTIKQLSPKMEDALHRPLDRSKYLERDLGKTPRRRIS
jgi:hypothetical protein